MENADLWINEVEDISRSVIQYFQFSGNQTGMMPDVSRGSARYWSGSSPFIFFIQHRPIEDNVIVKSAESFNFLPFVLRDGVDHTPQSLARRAI